MTSNRWWWMASTALILCAQPALAEAQVQTPAADTADDGEIVVSGYRTGLEQARDTKRRATGIQDSIAATDIAAFPDLNLAEALQRLPGVAINREAGEGRRISLRGLGPDFARVQLNGMEVLGNVDSPQDSRGQTTRDRAFDFNLFAAELFSRVDVRKSYSADQTEGGLAGTVGLFSARPFDNKGFRAAIGGQLGTNSLTKDVQPRFTALVSQNWGDVGILLSGAYSRRRTREEGFDTYRWRLNNASGSNISKLSAEDQAAVRSGTLRFARGNRLSVWDSTQERIGLTGSIQWKPMANATLTLDGLYGEFSGDRFETHLASRGGGGSTWLGGGGTFAGVTYPNSTINALQYNDQREVVYLDVSGANTATETRVQDTKNVFKQLVLSGDAEVAPGVRLTALGGVERSRFAIPVSDKFYLETYGDVISDYRGGTYSLVNTYKYDTADASRWHARNINIGATYQNSAFDNAKAALAWEAMPGGTFTVGGEWRRFENDGYGQGVDNVLLPEFRSGKVSSNIAAYARTYRDYPGQDWTVVDYAKALQALNLNRNDYLTARLNVFTVEERTTAAFAQYDWDQQIGSVPFRGNAGFRYYRTGVTSAGVANVGQVTVKGDYDGVLPAMNLVFEPARGLIVRAAAARNINRPGLGSLAVNGTVGRDNGEVTVSIGNPNLRPYKSTDLDLSIERYFGKVGYVAAALFYKTLDGFITNRTINNVPYGSTGLPTSILPGLTDATNVTSFSRPVNIGKTDIAGIELSGQSDFTFLPAPFDRFGTVLNLTLIDSKFDYATIIPGSTRTTLEGLSRINANATLYYQDARFNARVSGNYRSPYVFSASPVQSTFGKDQDVTGYEGTLYVDFSARYGILPRVQLTLDGINLTDVRERQYSDSTKRLYVSTHSGATVLGGVRVTF
ncbi:MULTISPECIES: TonB-dependent receptor [unclassified Sphingomonas]|uniref:TonB-dependent receptor n=1 Tax=unclassified Sphingomonas TaxID=196159 RepID=UPI0006F91C3A|nr:MULTISPECIES: TonB-dependent receptor [unclassified Sphingomonas]KQM63133.1 TonB-dependent receptor [Sphingomonas sp. Leaf16]KQN14992.1 TonB-dependent receptor [Sphingomonas sp. Leaf29]KQN20556.1 TonB-dependent receptor [Sphingomonas sp. Leaf32]